MSLDGLKDLVPQLMFLQQVAEGQDRGHVRDPVGDQGDAGKAAHRHHLNQSIYHRWIAQFVPLLLQMDPQHRLQRVRRPATLAAGPGVVRYD